LNIRKQQAKVIKQCSLGSANGRWILATTVLASGISFLMGTAVIIALPSIQSYFSTNLMNMQWVVNAYLLSLASLLLIGGSLGDYFGRKRVFALGLILFAIGGTVSGFAGTIALLIVFQAVQGVGSALMVPQSLAIINACFKEEQRGQVIGLWAGFSGGIAAIGPWLSGWLVDTFSWQAVFFMVLPVSILLFILTSIFIPENRDVEANKPNWQGTISIFAGLLGLSYALIAGPAVGWADRLVLISLIGGLLALAGFVFSELYQRQPLVQTAIFTNKFIVVANIVTFLVYFALNGVLFFLVLNLQQVQKYSPVEAGLALLPLIILITVLSGPSGTLADRIGPRTQMIFGPLLVAMGIAWLSVAGANASYVVNFLPGLMLVGIGMALLIAPLTKLALSVEPRFSGSASGINNAVSRIAALMTVAILGAVVISVFVTHLTSVILNLDISQVQQEQILSQSDKLGGIIIPKTFNTSDRILVENAIKESFVRGFRWAMGISSSMAFIGAVISLVALQRWPHNST